MRPRPPQRANWYSIQYASEGAATARGGAFRQPQEKGGVATGQLSLSYREGHGRKVAVLALLGAECEWPRLFEPRLTAWAGNEFKFVGLQREARKAKNVVVWSQERVNGKKIAGVSLASGRCDGK